MFFWKKISNHNFVWKINDEIVEVVDKLKYLGVIFSHNDSMKHAVNALNQHALRAFNHLLSSFYRVKMEVKTKLTMFNLVVLFCYTVQMFALYTAINI